MRAMLITISICLIVILSTLTFPLYAYAGVYPIPPQNDTSLVQQPLHLSIVKPPLPNKKNRHHKRKHVLRVYHHYHQHPHSRSGLYVYYSLPAPACCGPTWLIYHAKCCVTWGVWQPSNYATFNAAQEDIESGPTNDDEYRNWSDAP